MVTLKHLLTAAHCPVTFGFWSKANLTKVRCGDYHLGDPSDDSSVQVRKVKTSLIHSRYKYSRPNFDIAILVLEKNLRYSDFVRTICFQSLSNFQGTDDSSIAVGWGKDENGDHGQELKKVNVQIFDPVHCKNLLKHFDGFGHDLLCAAEPTGSGSGVCFGDSGGPLFSFNSRNLR